MTAAAKKINKTKNMMHLTSSWAEVVTSRFWSASCSWTSSRKQEVGLDCGCWPTLQSGSCRLSFDWPACWRPSVPSVTRIHVQDTEPVYCVDPTAAQTNSVFGKIMSLGGGEELVSMRKQGGAGCRRCFIETFMSRWRLVCKGLLGSSWTTSQKFGTSSF